jgi:hypothetical protein
VLRIVRTGKRKHIEKLERFLTDRIPGPENTRWAGEQSGPQLPAAQRRIDRFRPYMTDTTWPFTVLHW